MLLLDLDETLLDRTATFRRWAEAFCEECGGSTDDVEWLIEQDRGGYRPKADLVALVNTRLDPRQPLTVDSFRRTLASLFQCDPAVLLALGEARSGGWRLAIVTNGSAVQLDKVATSGLAPAVDAVCVSEIEECRKPDPHLLEIATERAGGSLAGAWLIGDNAEADIGAAAAAGIDSVWLRRGRDWTIEAYAPTATSDDVVSAIRLATQ